MNTNKNKILTPYSKKLRNEMTQEEKHLWYDFLKKLPLTINRQKVIGKYIIDFYCAEKKTAIELDGSQHYEKEGIEADKQRDNFLKAQGIKVLRYSNYDINYSYTSVCIDIMKNLGLDIP